MQNLPEDTSVTMIVDDATEERDKLTPEDEVDTAIAKANLVREMEQRYHCRYELGNGGSGRPAFPVTHVLEAGCVGADSGRTMRYAHIHISNGELLIWCISDAAGFPVIHGAEQNLDRTRAGYIHRALRHLQPYGARRVYPRSPAYRQGPARTADRRSPQGWPQ